MKKIIKNIKNLLGLREKKNEEIKPMGTKKIGEHIPYNEWGEMQLNKKELEIKKRQEKEFLK